MSEIYSDVLAKLFAAENINISIKNASTAYFNPETRSMVFPQWILTLPIASRELLMLHEASHALHTPKFGTHEKAKEYETVFRNILNILEDKRIEDAMKEKFPGAKSTFIRGFYELVNSNLFGIHFEDDMNGTSLLDRMNLYFKGDYYFDCEFTEEEQYWVDRAAQNKTFEEVYDNAVDLLEHLKENYAKEVLEKAKVNWEDVEFVDSDEYDDYEGDGGETEHLTMEDLENMLDEESFEKLQEALEEHNEQKAKEVIKEAINNGLQPDFEEKNSAQTDTEWEKNQERMKSSNEDKFANILNANLSRYLNWKDFVVPNSLVTDQIRKSISLVSSTKIEEFEKFMSEHRVEMAPVIAHMVREFMRKKAAEDFRRTKESKTGNLDLHKLVHYKYESNLFLNKAVTTEEKNHGFALLLDWSGSMNNIMTNAILQLIVNVIFCKSIQVPFVAYAFSTDATDTYDATEQIGICTHGVDIDSMRLNPKFKLVELIDSTKSNYEEQLRNLYYVAYSFLNVHQTRMGILEFEKYAARLDKRRKENKIGRYDYDGTDHVMVLSDIFELGSTPLNDGLILMNYILPDLKQNMVVDVMNLIVITDGDSDGMQMMATRKEPNTLKATAEFTEVLNTWGNPELRRQKGNWDEVLDAFYLNGSQSRYSYRGDESKFYCRLRQSNRVVCINDLMTRKFNSYVNNSNREFTRRLAALVKEETGANVICIELLTYKSTALRRYLSAYYNVTELDETEQIINDYRKNGFAVINRNGYDQIFCVNTNVICNSRYNSYYYGWDDDDSEQKQENAFDNMKENSKGTFTTRQLAVALEKNVSQKNRRKFLATRVVDVISEKQVKEEKKQKIVLDIPENLCYDQETV